jgi:L-ascorbate metabolism protein UlaG (beta-lactamase superfamily)
MTDRSDEGSWGWKQRENNSRMLELQGRDLSPATEGTVEIAYFGSSAFRITSPAGLSILIDPWRNHPRGNNDWYVCAFPPITADIAISTHAHFDHDALHLVSASTLIERPAGTYQFADAKITGIADKHVSDSSHSLLDWAEATRRLTPIRTHPPDNWRSFDNCIVIVETGGLRILHWGDNRPDPPESVWRMIGAVDIAILPVDGSRHVLSDAQADQIAERLGARIVIPYHYYVFGVTSHYSSLLPPDAWVNAKPHARWLSSPSLSLSRADLKLKQPEVWCFGAHVAFDKPVTNA